MFTDMLRKTNVIQHRVKLTDDTPIRCIPYPLLYAIGEELRNQVDSMLGMGVRRRLACRPSSWLRRKMVLTGLDLRKLNKITEVDP